MKKIFLLLFLSSIVFIQKINAQAEDYLNLGLIGVSYEIPIHPDFSVAPTAFTNFDFDYLTLGAKGNYYLDKITNLTPPWDVYIGANLGFGLALNNDNSSGLALGFQAGGRWFWSDKWGIYAEFGGGRLGGVGGGLGVTLKM
ncbi:MAG: hypothetical protein N4A46_12075 [Schleiferiaceae bacterium]|jgi:hypothetical protein|nr:hypothetical protein [Schleiferiaceae bacterium]